MVGARATENSSQILAIYSFFYVMFIKVLQSEYLTSDKDEKDYLETFKEVYIFGLLVYQKVMNSTNKEKTSKFTAGIKPKKIGFTEDKD